MNPFIRSIIAAFVALLAVAALSMATSCTTPQKIRIWEAIEKATRDDATPPPPVVTPAPTPVPEVKPTPAPCAVPAKPTSNTRRNFVWKHHSESDGKPVALIDAGFRTHVERFEFVWVWHTEVEAFEKEGQVFAEHIKEVGRFVGDTHNGCRPHFRFAEKSIGYIAPEGWVPYVRWWLKPDSRANDKDRGWHVIRIPDPTKDHRL